MSDARADVGTRKKIIDELINLGVLQGKNPETEFDAFLARRQAAMDYNNKCAQSAAVKSSEKSGVAHQSVFSYYDADEYPAGVTPQRYKTSLYRLSVEGGRVIQDAASHRKPTERSDDPHPNPLGIECPKSNISVATKQTFASSGGYFGKPSVENKPHMQASVLHAYAYEFENFSPRMIRENKCPFIVTTQGEPAEKFPALPCGIDQRGAFAENGKGVTPLYLDAEKYKHFVRDNLLKQMRSVSHAHSQSGMTDPIQMNLTLPGMGFFARLGTEHSLTGVLAGVASEGYKEAMQVYSEEQKKRSPKITGVRLSYPADSVTDGKVQREAIEHAFKIKGGESATKIGDISVRGTTRFVEELDGHKKVTEVVCVNGDPRTYPGNEPVLQSQEPGVYANIVGGRDALSPVIHPFSAFSPARHFSHASTQQPGKEVKLDVRVTQLEADLDKLQQQFQQKAQSAATPAAPKVEAMQPQKPAQLQRRDARLFGNDGLTGEQASLAKQIFTEQKQPDQDKAAIRLDENAITKIQNQAQLMSPRLQIKDTSDLIKALELVSQLRRIEFTSEACEFQQSGTSRNFQVIVPKGQLVAFQALLGIQAPDKSMYAKNSEIEQPPEPDRGSPKLR
jgi:hypothetical protein